jgi:hypothetical protein
MIRNNLEWAMTYGSDLDRTESRVNDYIIKSVVTRSHYTQDQTNARTRYDTKDYEYVVDSVGHALASVPPNRITSRTRVRQ